jgi:hypothetical protein
MRIVPVHPIQQYKVLKLSDLQKLPVVGATDT